MRARCSFIDRRGRQQRGKLAPHFDAAGAIANPVFVDVVLREILSQLPEPAATDK
jgi:hypothetical protein